MSLLLIVLLCSQVFRLSFFYTIRLDAETHQNRSPSMVNFAESSPATRVSSGSIAGATSIFQLRHPYFVGLDNLSLRASSKEGGSEDRSSPKKPPLASGCFGVYHVKCTQALQPMLNIPPGEAESREDAIFEEGFDALLQWRHLPMNTTDSMLQGLKFPHMDLFT